MNYEQFAGDSLTIRYSQFFPGEALEKLRPGNKDSMENKRKQSIAEEKYPGSAIHPLPSRRPQTLLLLGFLVCSYIYLGYTRMLVA